MKKTITAIFLLVGSLTSVSAQEYQIAPLPFNNSRSSQIAPFVKDSVLYFCSNKRNSALVGYFDQNQDPLYRWYSVDILADGKYGVPKPFLSSLQSKLNNGPITISADGTLLIATQSVGTLDSKGLITNGLVLYTSNGGQWIAPQPILPNANASIGQPSLSPDGKLMVFASNQPNGQGKTDLYITEYKNGQWSTPLNLGATVNTPGNDIFPFFHSSGKLYFASDGHNGMGGLDLFYTERKGDLWTTPVALPAPLNSESDDFAIYMMPEENAGYLTSNRNQTDNIFSFSQLWPSFDTCEPQVEDSYCFELYEDGAYQSDTLPVKYKWEFGDGQTADGKKVEHCFAGPGNYHVTLSAIDTLLNIEMFKVADYQMEVTQTEQLFITAPTSIKKGVAATFHAKDSYLPNLGNAEYFWEFGDGEKAKGIEVAHSFKTSGTFVVKCGTVSDVDPNTKYCSVLTITVD